MPKALNLEQRETLRDYVQACNDLDRAETALELAREATAQSRDRQQALWREVLRLQVPMEHVYIVGNQALFASGDYPKPWQATTMLEDEPPQDLPAPEAGPIVYSSEAIPGDERG